MDPVVRQSFSTKVSPGGKLLLPGTLWIFTSLTRAFVAWPIRSPLYRWPWFVAFKVKPLSPGVPPIVDSRYSWFVLYGAVGTDPAFVEVFGAISMIVLSMPA